MSYTYLLDLYKALKNRMAEIDKLIADDSALSLEQHHRLAGRRDCLDMVNSYLLEHYDQKLPRRMQQKGGK